MNHRAGEINRDTICLKVNDRLYELEIGHRPGQVLPSHTLSHTLRETIGLTGTKTPCNLGECGGCTVLIDQVPVLSCLTLTVECDGKRITTSKGFKTQKQVVCIRYNKRSSSMMPFNAECALLE